MVGLRHILGGSAGPMLLSAFVSPKISPSLVLTPLWPSARVPRRNHFSAGRGIRATAAVDTLAYDRSDASTGAGLGRRVFSQHCFYKKKAALCFRPIPATFRIMEGGTAAALARPGALLLEFANAVGERQYDWQRKQTFSISVGELGSLLSLRFTESRTLDMYHDPMKGKIGEGAIGKSLKVAPAKDGGFYFNLAVRERGNESIAISMPVSLAEFELFCSTANFLLPYLMGWHAMMEPYSLDFTQLGSGEAGGLNPETEWEE